MPLVIVTGHPCCGKTRYVSELVQYLHAKHTCDAVVINEESLDISKADGYSSSMVEKVTRAALKSAVDHALSSSSWVIIDSLNYIKGFRYELHCLARTVKSTHCTVWVTCNENDSNTWSTSRDDNGQDNYPNHILVDLRRRFEPPNERNRWDRPLIRVNTSDTETTASATGEGNTPVTTKSASITSNVEEKEEIISSSFRRKGKISGGASVSSQFTRKTAPKTGLPDALIFNRFDAIVEQDEGQNNKKESGASSDDIVHQEELSSYERIYQSLSASIIAQPNSSTVAVPHGGADILYELDKVSQEIVHIIAIHLSGAEAQVGAPLVLPAYDRSLQLHRTVSMPELNRHRTQFVRLNSKHPPPDATAVGSMFIDFLAVQL